MPLTAQLSHLDQPATHNSLLPAQTCLHSPTPFSQPNDGSEAQDLQRFLAQWLANNDIPTATEVNSGMCEDFALDLAELLEGSEVVYTENYVDWDSDAYPGGHAWVLHQGRCYDAECLEGVGDWRSLPFFVRRLRGQAQCPKAPAA